MSPDLSLAIAISAPPDAVFALVCDPEAHGALHPLAQEVHLQARTPEEQITEETRFVVIDRVKVLGFPIRISVQGRMRVSPGRRVDFEARAGLGITVRTTYRVVAIDAGSRLEETTTIVCRIPWLRPKVERDARAAHQALLEAFKRRLEGTA